MTPFRIVQAPMANNQPAGFAAAVCRAGAVGVIAGAALSADDLRAQIRAMPADAVFGVNLFAAPYLREANLAVVLEERPPVFSFTFGLVEPAPLQEAGIEVWGTATSLDEARVLAAAGVDVVVVQGGEAGGHRGSFLDDFPLVPVADLVAECVDVGPPVIAAGGITTRDDVHAMRELGAAGVQVGTAFLFTHECERPPAHLDALREYDTAVTDAYTGRPMRAACDDVLQSLIDGPAPLPFPEQRKVAAEKGPVFMGGTSARRCREQSVAELVAELCAA